LNREWFFEDTAKAKILHEIILNAGDIKNHIVYQFCIMPDHVHLLCKTGYGSPHRTLEKVRCGDGGMHDTAHSRNVPFPGCGAGNKKWCRAALSNFIQSIKGTFSRRMHMGHIWQRRFHDEIIETDQHLEGVISYITHNPVKAELPEKWKKYPYQYMNDELIHRLFF
jgi:REP element-mobilizing transposase RayT